MTELTESQVAELSSDIEALLLELEEAIERGRGATATVDLDQSIGRVTRIDALQRQKIAAEQVRRHEIRRAQARAAMTRMESDEYGYCVSCDEPIGYRRLKARPESPRCIDCAG